MIANRLRIILPLGFFLFIAFIIYLADTADYNFAFRVIGQIPNGDKVMHGLLYGVMALLLNYGLKFSIEVRCPLFHYTPLHKIVDTRPLVFMQLGAIIVLTFAGLEEISQYWLPSRTCDVFDFVADTVGVILFSLIKDTQSKI